MRSGAACLATLLIALWMTAAAAEPNFRRRFGIRKTHRPRNPHHKQNVETTTSEDSPHKGFALKGHAYYKGQFVKCPPKKTLVCKDDNCIIPDCDTLKLEKLDKTKLCKSGEYSMMCKTPLVCECDNAAGYFESTEQHTKGKCILEEECFVVDGSVKPDKRCPYSGCSDSVTCKEVWSANFIPCTNENELQKCDKPEMRCPLHHYWDDARHCVRKDHCMSCSIPHQVPLCPSPKCPDLTCENVWDLRHGHHGCPRPEEYPDCKQMPVCTCDPTFDFVFNDGKCQLSSQCITCPVDETVYCPGQDGCVERTFSDIEDNTENKPCEPLTTYKCPVKPKCQCIYPLIRNKDGKCVGPDQLFPECNKDDSSMPVCRVDGCEVRHCGNMPFGEKKLCSGTDDALYHCSRNKIFCQCNKGTVIYNLSPDSMGSRYKCNTAKMCEAINEAVDDEDYDED